MNATNVSRIGMGLSLTLTALLLAGAPVLTTSCAGGDSDTGGSAGGQGGGAGGAGGSGGGATNCSDPAADAVNFCNGKAQGVMTGYAYIALGKLDTATDPKCAEDPSVPSNTREITADGTSPGPCPTSGTTVWKNEGDLCISGTIPVVTGGDYTSNWGLQIGVNTVDPPATSAGSGTLNQTYSTIAMTTTGTITPTNTAVRIVIHTVDMAVDANPYCATMQSSGKPIDLTAFNTACWDGSGEKLTADKIPTIDKIGIQISSDTSNEYTVTDFCLTGIQFSN
jgi:hypothetical protein